MELAPHLRYQYFERREQPGLHTLFRNPMLLMLLFTCGMVVFMPKLMDAMDPEERAQMQKQMAGAQDPQRPAPSSAARPRRAPRAQL